MNLRPSVPVLAFTVAFVVRAQSEIKVGDFDPPALDGLKGEIGCVAYHLDSLCEYVLGYVVNGAETVVVLEQFQRRLESGEALSVIVDLVKVPPEFAGTLKVLGCRYDGDEMRPMVAAVSARDFRDWAGPAEWVVLVDFEEVRLVSGNPQLVECRSISGHG
jgi:hypothetical protein